MKYKILTLLLSCIPLLGQTVPSEEIRVYLSTSSALKPLYLGKIECQDGSFDAKYLSELHSVLAFDFNYNGSTRTVPTQNDRSVAYVIKGEVQNKSLTLSYYTSQPSLQKKLPPLALTGSLARDRKSLHRLSDAIYKSLFGKEGVASTKIIFTTKQKKGDKYVSEVWSCDWDGANSHEITRENHLCVTPVFLPPSNNYSNDKFLYVSFKQGKSKIFIGSLTQSTGKRLVELNGNQMLPAISADRKKIAFICDASGRADLFMQEFNPETGAKGKPVQLFSFPRSTQASPTFSPDGSKIAFVSDKDGSPRIYLLPAVFHEKRGKPALLSKRNTENSCPSWSPDGKKIAYSAKTKGTRQIWIYEFDTGEEWQLTDGSGNKENPSWAPDSEHLVFNSTDGHISELYLVNLNQPDVIKISSGPGVKHYPSWGAK